MLFLSYNKKYAFVKRSLCFMKMSNTEALEKESTGRLLIRLSAPAMAGMFLISLYNAVDAFFVGRGVGPMGIAAVFISFPATLVVMAVAQTFGVGGASVISRRLGEKRRDVAESTLGTMLSVGGICGVVMGVLLMIGTKSLIRFLGGSEDMLPMASSYAYVIFAGTPFFTLMMIMNNLVRGEGNTKLSMWSMAISSVSNIILDALFIFVFRWGLPGAAWATVISQVLAVIWLLSYYTGGRSAVTLRKKCLRPSLPVLIESVKVGSSAFVRQVGIALSWGVLNKIFAGTGGDMAVASSGVVQRMLAIVVMPIIGMGHGLLPIVGYNYGARHYDRVIDVMKKSNYISTIFCAVSALILFAFPGEILGFFSDDPNMLAMGVPGARLAALGMVTIGSQVMISTFYQGTGKGALSFFLSMLRPLILHPPLAAVLGGAFGLMGAWASFPAADFCAIIITYFIYRRGRAAILGVSKVRGRI